MITLSRMVVNIVVNNLLWCCWPVDAGFAGTTCGLPLRYHFAGQQGPLGFNAHCLPLVLNSKAIDKSVNK
jgi:hypothetical protein